MTSSPGPAVLPDLVDDARAVAGDIADLRHRLHAEPEIGLSLPRTQEKVLAALDGLPLEVTTGTTTTSVTAVLRGGAVSATQQNGNVARADRPVVLLRGDHGSTPHLSRDPIAAACEMVSALQVAMSRSIDTFAPTVLTIGSFHAGTKRNIIPETATFEATVRTFDRSVRHVLMDTLRRVCEGIARAHGVDVEVRYDEEYPVTVNDQAEAAFALGVAEDLFGAGAALRMPNPITGSEDFSRVIAEVPGAMLFLGALIDGRDPLTAPSNHAPQAAF